MDTDALIAFLNARLADDVAYVDSCVDAELGELRMANAGTATREEIMEHSADLRRRLAEVDAKRRILDLHDQGGVRWTGFPRADRQERYCVHDQTAAPCRTLRLLALPYVGHPDFREEWKP